MATEVKIPDIGDFKDIPIIEVHVKEGDAVNADDPLVSLESDKATMEVPAPQGGTIEKLLIKIGDKVSEGTPIVLLRGGDGGLTQPPSLVEQQEPKPSEQPSPTSKPAASPAGAPSPAPDAGGVGQAANFGQAHASPSVRRLARELEVDLGKIKGTGEKGRITREDVKAFLRGPAGAPAAAQRLLAAWASPKSRLRTFPSSGRSKPKLCPASRKSRGRTCIVPGSTSPT